MQEDYLYECASADIEALARVIAGLFPEQTRFTERAADGGPPQLVAHWIAMRFGTAARRMTLTVSFEPAAFARYRALPPRARARSYAVLHAYVETMLGSLEEQHADGQTVERDVQIELGDEFA